VPAGLARLFCALIFCLVAQVSPGASWTWNGNGGNANWSTTGNWISGTAPTSANTTDLFFAGTNNTGTLLAPLNQNIATPFLLNNLTFSSGAGSFFLGGGALRFDGGSSNTITQSSSSAQNIANAINAPSTNGSVTLTLSGNGTGIVTMSGVIAIGTGQRDYAITKTGTSTFSLSGANTYGGLTTISSGVLNIQNAFALGSTSSGTSVASGAALQLEGGISVGNETLALNGSGIASDGALRNISGNNSYAGVITLGSASTIASDAGTLTISGGIVNGGFGVTFGGSSNVTSSGIISGTGALIKDGNGTLILNATNTFSGGSTINGGTVIANSAASLGASTGAATINAGTLDVAATFSSTRNFILGNTASTFMVDPTHTFTSTGVISGTGTLNKTGTGTMVLSGANTYSGATTVSTGTLTLSTGSGSALGGTSSVTVNSSGTLMLGAGNQINNAATMTLNGGTLALNGKSEGAAGTTGVGALTLTATSTIDFAIGTTSSIIQFAGLGTHTASTLLQVTNWNGTPATGGGTERLLFAGTTTSFTSLYGQSDVTFNGAAGYDAVQFAGYYEITAVPEPATWLTAAFALATGAFHQRRRLRGFLLRRAA
jgi:autotransporter-associated beta strand protein